jgi:hypothetical protein
VDGLDIGRSAEVEVKLDSGHFDDFKLFKCKCWFGMCRASQRVSIISLLNWEVDRRQKVNSGNIEGGW